MWAGQTAGSAGLFCAALLLVVSACSSGSDVSPTRRPGSPTVSATSASGAPSGRIVFNRGDVGSGASSLYTMNTDGSDVALLFERGANNARWAPHGGTISFFCCDDGMAAHFVDADTEAFRETAPPDPDLEIHCGFAWSPDGKRLPCESYGVDDPNRNGIYTIRASDGGGLTRITSNPGGGDIPGDYSPDGKRLVFVRSRNERPVGIFVVNVDGSGLRRVTPKTMVLDESGFAASWSPNNDLLVVAHEGASGPKRIWIVNADGGALRPLPMTLDCDAGCYSPSWSPDGKKIVFVRHLGSGESIYTADADGTNPVELTEGDNPDWEPGPY
jgi:Tol biopolymer transport system component